MYFSNPPSQKEFEKLMQAVPHFSPRGHGSFIPKEELNLYERPQPPPASLSDAIERTMSRIHCPPFRRRLEKYLRESEESPMDYRNEKHRIAFTEAIQKLNRKDYALMSAVYLLTAEHALWMKAKQRVRQNEIHFDAIKLQNSTENAYPKLEDMLLNLAARLSKTGGKKVYGYLKADVKAIINAIVDEIAVDERIATLYDLWYEQREEVIRTYTDETPERVPLSQNKEFKSIKNAVIQEAMNIIADRTPIEEAEEQPAPDPEPSDTETEPVLTDKEKKSLMWQYYSRAKEHLDKESMNYNPNTAVEYLIEASKLGCGVAKYRLGKMFLRGDEVSKNVNYALRWLEESVSEKNQYAEYLLGKTYLKGEDVEQDLIRAENLLRHSSAQDNRYAKYTLGKSLLDGELFLQDIPEAIRLLAESADSGFAPAQYLLGKLLYKGEVVPQDLQKAIAYLEKAAAQKNPYAAYLAGKIRLTEDAVKGIGKAIRNFEIAAENGNDYMRTSTMQCI